MAIAREFLALYDGSLTPDNINSELYRWITAQYLMHFGAMKASRAIGYTPPSTSPATDCERFRIAQDRASIIAQCLAQLVTRRRPDPLAPITPVGPPLGRTPGYDAKVIQDVPMSDWGAVRGQFITRNEDQGIFCPQTRRY